MMPPAPRPLQVGGGRQQHPKKTHSGIRPRSMVNYYTPPRVSSPLPVMTVNPPP
ncbi:hypothetical protein GQ53DRAFT_751647 [Thozetella sp. PMI_491]|nr:hypothetical protein GQ53DRAFT_751647 [Thozetella sp. PMI_491]